MKSISINLPRDKKHIEIKTFADFHIGDKLCDYEYIKDQINDVKQSDNKYVILNGDIMNIALKSSVSDIYEETLSPSKQLEYVEEIFSPIKDKILCITQGNHERRIAKQDGFDITLLMAKQLGLSDRYAKGSALIFLRLGELNKKATGKSNNRQVCYTINVTHGSRGGRTSGSKVSALTEMASIVDADIYIHSHTHLSMVLRERFFRTDTKNSTVSLVEKLFVNTGSALDYGGYGEIAEYKPTSKITPTIILRGDRKEYCTRF